MKLHTHARSDEELLTAIGFGDESALSDYYDRHADVVFALACRILHERSEAEEVLLEVFTHLWERSRRRGPGGFGCISSLLMLTRELALARRRYNRMHHGDNHELFTAKPNGSGNGNGTRQAAESTDESSSRVRWRRRVCTALDTMAPSHRQALEMAYYDGMSARQIAERLNISPKDAERRIVQGLTHVRNTCHQETKGL
jgi:RNA polymerase sigma-70 factor, ECF subfamily